MLRNRAKRKYGTVAKEIQFLGFYRTAIKNIHAGILTWIFALRAVFVHSGCVYRATCQNGKIQGNTPIITSPMTSWSGRPTFT